MWSVSVFINHIINYWSCFSFARCKHNETSPDPLILHSFVEGARIGVKLKEAWLVTNALVYAWNHTAHCAVNNQYVNVLDPLASLATVADALVKVRCSCESLSLYYHNAFQLFGFSLWELFSMLIKFISHLEPL